MSKSRIAPPRRAVAQEDFEKLSNVENTVSTRKAKVITDTDQYIKERNYPNYQTNPPYELEQKGVIRARGSRENFVIEAVETFPNPDDELEQKSKVLQPAFKWKLLHASHYWDPECPFCIAVERARQKDEAMMRSTRKMLRFGPDDETDEEYDNYRETHRMMCGEPSIARTFLFQFKDGSEHTITEFINPLKESKLDPMSWLDQKQRDNFVQCFRVDKAFLANQERHRRFFASLQEETMLFFKDQQRVLKEEALIAQALPMFRSMCVAFQMVVEELDSWKPFKPLTRQPQIKWITTPVPKDYEIVDGGRKK